MYYESTEDKIRRLESELYRARRTIFDLLPNDIKAVAKSYWAVKSRREAHEWESSVANAVIELAGPFAQEAYDGTRAYCPLCKRDRLAVVWLRTHTLIIFEQTTIDTAQE